MQKLKIGIFGIGHLGKIHLKLIQELDSCFEIVGYSDPNPAVQQWMLENTSITLFNTASELIKLVDCVDVVCNTTKHYDIAKLAIELNKHVFIEKPATAELWQTQELAQLAQEMNVKVQIGFVERFNPAFLAVKSEIHNPQYLEFVRHAKYNPRGTDVSVVHDLSIHDLDLALSLIHANPIEVYANGFSTISSTEDVVSARIHFDNGSVVNFSTSRNSEENRRSFTVYQGKDSFFIDLLNKKVKVLHYPHSTNGRADESCELPVKITGRKVVESNAIRDELLTFHKSITNNSEPFCSIHDALRVAHLVEMIMNKLELVSLEK